MTRINADIPVQALSDYHLIAELEEIPRVVELYKKRIHSGVPFNDIPKVFTLGDGHVKFFLNKGNYLIKRYESIYKELTNRNISCINNVNIFYTMQLEHRKNYEFSTKENSLIVTRIINRITESNKLPVFYGVRVSKELAIEQLLEVAPLLEEKQFSLEL